MRREGCEFREYKGTVLRRAARVSVMSLRRTSKEEFDHRVVDSPDAMDTVENKCGCPPNVAYLPRYPCKEEGPGE